MAGNYVDQLVPDARRQRGEPVFSTFDAWDGDDIVAGGNLFVKNLAG